MTRLVDLIARFNEEKLRPGEPPMNQRRLAERVGLNEATVSRHVNGVTTIDLPQAVAYARALACTVDDLVEDSPPEDPRAAIA